MENKLLSAACYGGSAFDKLVDCDARSQLSDKGKIVFDAIAEYYERDSECTRVDKDILTDRLVRAYPKHEDLFKAIVGSFEEVSVPNIVEEVVELKKRNLKDELAAACTADNNDEVIADIYAKLELLNAGDPSKEGNAVYAGVSALDVVNETTGGSLIKLWPPALNEAVGGGVLRQTHIVVFARPDVGKTTFAVNLTAGFLRQGLKTLYIGNEDPAHHIIKRIIGRVAGMSSSEIERNPDKADAILATRNWDKLVFVEMSPGSPAEVKEQVEQFRPDVLIVDQTRNLNMREQNKVLQLEKACQFVRQIGKRHDMVTVSFTQAGDSADNKLVLEMGDVDFSNTGVQSTADLMIGLGCNGDYERQSQRMLAFPKNKINGNKEPVRIGVDWTTFTMR